MCLLTIRYWDQVNFQVLASVIGGALLRCRCWQLARKKRPNPYHKQNLTRRNYKHLTAANLSRRPTRVWRERLDNGRRRERSRDDDTSASITVGIDTHKPFPRALHRASWCSKHAAATTLTSSPKCLPPRNHTPPLRRRMTPWRSCSTRRATRGAAQPCTWPPARVAVGALSLPCSRACTQAKPPRAPIDGW